MGGSVEEVKGNDNMMYEVRREAAIIQKIGTKYMYTEEVVAMITYPIN